MITLAHFKQCYAVVSAPVLLVNVIGQVIAANSEALQALSIAHETLEKDRLHLRELLLEEDDKVIAFLTQCARMTQPVRSSFTVRGNNNPQTYSFRGQLLNKESAMGPAQVVIYAQQQESFTRDFLALNEKVRKLSDEIKRRQELEVERATLLDRERDAKLEAQHLFEQAQEAAQAKSLFLAQMSHEIRTPLNAILGFSDLLGDNPDLDEQHRFYLNRLVTNGQHLLRIIDDILDLSKFESRKANVEKIPVAFIEAVQASIQALLPVAESKGLKLSLHLDQAVPRCIQTDPVRFRQIMTNLIGNAIKFTERGRVDVHLNYIPAPDQQSSPQVSIEVLDTGIGITTRQQLRLFKAFETGDAARNRRFGGAGLGLIISLKIAQALGGELELLSTVTNQGSRFRLILPASSTQEFVEQLEDFKPTAKLVQTPDPLPQGPRLADRRILIAEDSPDSAALAKLYLQSEGAEVTLVGDGFAAVEAVSQAKFDLVLMDIQMPGMDGLEATRVLRHRGFAKPILTLTAHAFKEECERSLQAGCNAHLTKPINRKDLIHAVSKALS